MFLDELTAEAVDAFVASGVPPLLTIEIRQLGGALAEPSPQHGAVGSIDASYVMFAAGLAMTPQLGAAVAAAVDCAKAALAPWASERTYFNFSERPVDPARLYPAETYRRLRKIRAAYDPGELFVANHPITQNGER
jgi:berberine-like enzyme